MLRWKKIHEFPVMVDLQTVYVHEAANVAEWFCACVSCVTHSDSALVRVAAGQFLATPCQWLIG